MTCPLFVELCAGTAALSLRLHHPRARPPVSRMGAKTGYADVILRCLGLYPGQGAADGTRFGWFEPDPGVRLLLHAYRDRSLALAAADIIRSWKDEEPRALWERLRAEGPAVCPPVDAREVARWALSRIWGNGGEPGVNQGWNGGYSGPGHGRHWKAVTIERAAQRIGESLTLPATIADDARAVDPREVARWACGMLWTVAGTWPVGGFCGPGHVSKSGKVPFPSGTTYQRHIASRFDRVPCGLPATIADDARTVPTPARLPAGTVAYIDPPYLNTTGYAHLLPRDEWLPVVRRWRDAGALVCVSEAEPIPDLMAEGWHAVEITGERRGQKRTFGGTREWLTMSEPPRWRPSVQFTLFGAPVTHSTGRD